eukprot:5257560-Pleurochrysis_carterae.AAC.1
MDRIAKFCAANLHHEYIRSLDSLAHMTLNIFGDGHSCRHQLQADEMCGASRIGLSPRVEHLLAAAIV